MSMDNLWTRRTNTSRLSPTSSLHEVNGITTTNPEGSGRTSLLSKRPGNDFSSLSKKPSLTVPQGSMTTSSTAFALGSGAFASFGSAKTPKSPGSSFEAYEAKTPTSAMPIDETLGKNGGSQPASTELISPHSAHLPGPTSPSMLRDGWCFWFRPPVAKSHGFVDYEKTLHGIASVQTVEDFFNVYRHLKRPSALPAVSDYHLFKAGVRPVWEDDENKKGGKWVVRLKKGVADRLWEDLILALIGDQFGDASDDVCGAVLSVRSGEDILSIWTKTAGRRVLKIRETMRHVLGFPPMTRLEFKSHDSSMQQQTAKEESRREKSVHQQLGEKRPTGSAPKTSPEEKWDLRAP